MKGLPFLDDNKWPISKEPEERVANPSYETQIQDHLVEEIFRAMESKDHSSLRESLMALIQELMNGESDEV